VGDTLLQYGAIGAILMATLTVFLWAFKRLFDHFLNQQDKKEERIGTFMDESVGAMRDIREQIKIGNMELLAEIRALSAAHVSRIVEEIKERRPSR